MNRYTFADLSVGLSCSFEAVVTEPMMRNFLAATGDDNPLHIDADFARSRGFEGPVVYGLLASSFYSTLVGVHLPGRNGILQGIQMDFHKPIYVGQPFNVRGEITFLSEATRLVEIAARIESTSGVLLSKAKIRVGVRE